MIIKSKVRGAACVMVVLGILLLSLPGVAYSQPIEVDKYKITLRSRTFTPYPGIDSMYRDNLEYRLERGESRHVIVQLKRFLTVEERSELEKRGVKLLSYVNSYAWYATITSQQALQFTSPTVTTRDTTLGWIRWIGEIKPEDRVVPDLLKPEMRKWIRMQDGRERYSVYFFKDIPLDSARQTIINLGGEIEDEAILTNGLLVNLPPSVRSQLMVEDIVQLIGFYPPTFIDNNDGSRAWCNTDAVHTAGIDGEGVILGIWEATGLPRNQHVDLTTVRCHWEDALSVTEHATHVCGTIIGTGTGLAIRRGHASGVNDIRCYVADNFAPADEIAEGFHDYGIVAANNSWAPAVGWVYYDPDGLGPLPSFWDFEPSTAAGDPINAAPQSYFGDYDVFCQEYDMVVRDSGVVVIFASGNERNNPTDGSQSAAEPGDWDQIDGAIVGSWDGFHTISPMGTAKNVITVGAINDATGAMSTFSSWGPTDDGRIKPEVVAPGVSIQSCDDTDTDGDGIFDHYKAKGGTSMAAPAVTGIVALLIQSYRQDYLNPSGGLTLIETPLPSTIKAILCQSAEDMGDPGPDYQFGWGGVRADAARQIIVEEKFREGVIAAMDDRDIYEFTVSPGDPEIRITLAWDDEHGAIFNSTSTNAELVNDLDLVIEDPTGNLYAPWHLYANTNTPNDADNPATRNSLGVAVIPDADRDSVNNVEQVYIEAGDFVTGSIPTGTWKIIVEPHDLPEPVQRYSLAANIDMESVVEIVQVLDRSGSMTEDAALGSTDDKIDVLQDAADLVVDMVERNVDHKMGLVQYRDDVVPFSEDVSLNNVVEDQSPTPYTTTLHSMIDEVDDDLYPWHTTSIGDGLYEALNQFDTYGNPDNRQVILLMTDGKGNTHLGVDELWDPVNPENAAWVDNKAIIYTLGLGHDGGICSDTLAWLAESTGGDFRQTSEPIEFTKFFIEALAGAVGTFPATDPMEVLAPGSKKSFPVVVSDYDQSITFTTYWSDIDNALQMVVLNPNGDSISPSAPGVRYTAGDRYILYQIEKTETNWAGEWRMEVRSKANQTVSYSTSSVVKSDIKFDAGFDKIYSLTGDRIRVWAKVSSPVFPEPPPGPKVVAYCDKPLTGVGNVLHDFTYDPAKLKVADTLADIDPVVLKLDILRRETGKEVLLRGESKIVLYDDGAHEDGAAGDGFYANTFTDTKIQGTYTFRFVASDIPAGRGLKTTREWSKSFFNQVNVDPKFSDIDITHLKGGKYNVRIVPKDRFGNYLGPGYPVAVSVTSPKTRRQVILTDNIDGTYMQEIELTRQEQRAGARLEVEVDGKSFTTVEPPPPERKPCLGLF